MSCPLCLHDDYQHYHRDQFRDYWQCHHCYLVFVMPNQFISANEEKAIYDLHQNDADDLGYQRFLNKLLMPLKERLLNGAHGMDYGSGPGPAVDTIMQKSGFKVDNYDIFYAKNESLLKKTYDFITCTEVLEHLHKPHEQMNLLVGLLKPNAYLGIMTKRVISQERFKNWHYKNDVTHVCFYSVETFNFIAEHWSIDLQIINDDTVIFRR